MTQSCFKIHSCIASYTYIQIVAVRRLLGLAVVVVNVLELHRCNNYCLSIKHIILMVYSGEVNKETCSYL